MIRAVGAALLASTLDWPSKNGLCPWARPCANQKTHLVCTWYHISICSQQPLIWAEKTPRKCGSPEQKQTFFGVKLCVITKVWRYPESHLDSQKSSPWSHLDSEFRGLRQLYYFISIFSKENLHWRVQKKPIWNPNQPEMLDVSCWKQQYKEIYWKSRLMLQPSLPTICGKIS